MTTNDRFSARLRQHLLESANERPADGQLAAVVDAVAATSQRMPLVARLAWQFGPLGRFPAAVVRYGVIAVALALATVAGAFVGGGNARQPSTVFEGSWTAVDPGDGSGLTLVVGAGPTPVVYFEDGYASGRACVSDPVKRFTARGTGVISGSRLVATFPDGGGCGLATVGVAGAYEYDDRTDTLSDQDRVVWTRVLGEQPAERTPIPSPSARPGAALGETFTSTVHGIALGYPVGWQARAATEPWTGGELGFDSASADVIFDPTLGGRLYLLVASQAYGNLDADAWREAVLAWTCPGHDGGEFWSWRVDGASSWQQGPCNSGSIVDAGTRGYLIRLVVSPDEPGLADTYDWDWLMPLLETVDLRPDEALALPAVDPDPTGAAVVSPDPNIASPEIEP